MYKYIDNELCCDLAQSYDQFTVSDLIEIFNEQKNIWFNIYTYNQSLMLNRLMQQYLSQQFDKNCFFQFFNVKFKDNQFCLQFSYVSYVSYENQFFNYQLSSYQNWNNCSQKQQYYDNVADESCWYSLLNSLLMS